MGVPSGKRTLRGTLVSVSGSNQLSLVSANSNQCVGDSSPTDDTWCPDCEQFDGGYIEDVGLGFTLYREGEWSGEFETYAEAVAEAKQSDRDYLIEANSK